MSCNLWGDNLFIYFGGQLAVAWGGIMQYETFVLYSCRKGKCCKIQYHVNSAELMLFSNLTNKFKFHVTETGKMNLLFIHLEYWTLTFLKALFRNSERL